MPAQIIKTRARFFIAVEGESEQSFFTWLQILSERDLHIHLDTFLLGGGGFKSMLAKTLRQHKRRCRISGVYQERFLVVDVDRAEHGDWSIEALRREAARHKITVCAQNPNHEGLLLRMMPGMERTTLATVATLRKLQHHWPAYQKPMNAQSLGRQFSLEDLLRAARIEPDLEFLLKKIGLMR